MLSPPFLCTVHSGALGPTRPNPGFQGSTRSSSQTCLWTRIPRELVKGSAAWAPPPQSGSLGLQLTHLLFLFLFLFLTSSQEIPHLNWVGEPLTTQGQHPTPDPDRLVQIPSPRQCAGGFVLLWSLIKPNPSLLGSEVSSLSIRVGSRKSILCLPALKAACCSFH